MHSFDYDAEGRLTRDSGPVGAFSQQKYGPTLDVNLPGVDDIFKVHVGH